MEKIYNRKYSDEVKVVNNIEIGKAVRTSYSYPGIFAKVVTN